MAKEFAYKSPQYVSGALELLGDVLKEHVLVQENPCTDCGEAGRYSNGTFSLESQCWCNGGLPFHEESCPPNFEFKGKYLNFKVSWNVYSDAETVNSFTTQNLPISAVEMCRILNECVESIKTWRSMRV